MPILFWTNWTFITPWRIACSEKAVSITKETTLRSVNLQIIWPWLKYNPVIQDLSQLGRPICDTIILDNAPASYLFHPKNAVPVSSWFNDQYDAELTDLIPFLADLNSVSDVRSILGGIRWWRIAFMCCLDWEQNIIMLLHILSLCILYIIYLTHTVTRQTFASPISPQVHEAFISCNWYF